MSRQALALLLLLACPFLSESVCPYLAHGTPPLDYAEVPELPVHAQALKELDLEDVVSDLEALMTHSDDCWPADFGHYGPLFVRLAWHCSGTYRITDGLGGCAGGRQRYEPERSWDDNTNLDKARALLGPIKERYGDGLSWGDLLVLAGTAAIRHMGGPVSQYCAGRLDSMDGTESYDLGPTPQQEHAAPCEVQGQCKKPLGTSTVGLIYVNPEGPVKEQRDGTFAPDPNPKDSAKDIREVFSRMGMNDSETVALIGGGHAFGKTHGVCPEGPGLPPNQDVDNPWAGNCGTGKGNDTFTSGFEGAWTSTPTKWSNEFFVVLKNNRWVKHHSPAKHTQWRARHAEGPLANVMRLTTDVALIFDRSYKKIVQEYAKDAGALEVAFDAAWFKLTHSGGRWSEEKKCISMITTTPPANEEPDTVEVILP